MAKVTIEDYYGKQKKCEYVLAYYKAQGLKPGDDWKTYEYIHGFKKNMQNFIEYSVCRKMLFIGKVIMKIC